MLNLLNKRRSVKQFKDREVTDTTIAGLLKAATLAPSSYNKQPWKYLILDKEFPIQEVIMDGNEWLKKAPLIIAVFTQKGENHFNTGLSVENLVLKATEDGLSAHIVGGFYRDRLQILTKTPEDFEPVCMIAIGYPDEKPVKEKKNETDIAYISTFGEPWTVHVKTEPLKTFEYKVDLRFRDLDAMGHVNNSVYLTFMEEARIATRDLMTGKITDPLSFNVVVAEHSIQYRKSIVYGETITLYSWISNIQEKSYRFNYKMVNEEGEIKSIAWTTMVGFNYKTGEVLTISDEFKHAVKDYSV